MTFRTEMEQEHIFIEVLNVNRMLQSPSLGHGLFEGTHIVRAFGPELPYQNRAGKRLGEPRSEPIEVGRGPK
jgi:hypothetical protein